ncbi:MAG: hypothetical protein ACI8XO_001208 [Verrucomicrobiales bacterium]|jgi:hypothetical protein
MASKNRIAYLADGRLFMKEGAADPHEILCTFAEELKQRMAQLQQKNEWKNSGGNSMTGAMVWGGDPFDEGHVGTSIAAIAPSAEDGELVYGLNTDDVAGIFLRPIRQNADEKRLIHTSDSNIHTLSSPDGDGRIACSISSRGGLQNLSIYCIGSPGFTEITEGDSLDAAAAWIPGREGHLVYQSAGIGRDGFGQWIDTGPASIEHLDTTRGEIRTLLQDRQYDFLSPQVSGKGKLYCIRRPYKDVDKIGFGKFARGWLGAPFRLVGAIGSWMNLFSVRYTGKPLNSAGGPPTESPDLRKMMMLGNVIDAEKVREEAARRGDKNPDLVPRSWQLIETSLENPSLAGARILAKGVIAYHIDDAGGIIYSNGSAIFRQGDGGKPELVAEAHNVQQLLSLD